MAAASGDGARASLYRQTADAWAAKPGDNVETWLFTTNGGLGNGRYFIRIGGAASFDETWNPNGELEFGLANGAGRWREKDLTDGGFLELVRFGVKPALDPAILETLPEYDSTIRVDIPGIGPGFRRYFHDRYGYEDATGVQTDGMLWPLLTGERGHYELQRAIESAGSPGQAQVSRKQRVAIDAAVAPYVATMERMATSTFMLPEQVWDFGARAGGPTGSATPLGWSHGEYLKLLRSRADGAVFDRLR
jgi:glucoamylase